MLSKILDFEGSNYLRQRLILATLTGICVRIRGIHADDDQVGLREEEMAFLRLLEKCTNGSVIEINYTGTAIKYVPGAIIGGVVEHDCPSARSIGFYLEFIAIMALFGKNKLQLTLTGVTNATGDTGVDTIRTVMLPMLRRYGVADGLELKIKKRGALPLGGGQVYFECPVVRQLSACQFTDPGRIKKIRGIAYCTRVPPPTSSRVVESARSLLNRFIPDVFIYTDAYKGSETGLSPGYALTLVAESTTGALASAECVAQPGQSPEDVGLIASKALYREISLCGSVDTNHQWVALLMMAFGPEDVSKVTFGTISPFSMQLLRDLKTFCGTMFKIQPCTADNTVQLTCVGNGIVNFNKKVT